MKITLSYDVDLQRLQEFLQTEEGRELEELLARLQKLQPEDIRAMGEEPEATWWGWNL
jgi:hypothetical protein